MTSPATHTCTACDSTFTTSKAARRHAKGRGHMVLIDDVPEPNNLPTTERTP